MLRTCLSAADTLVTNKCTAKGPDGKDTTLRGSILTDGVVSISDGEPGGRPVVGLNPSIQFVQSPDIASPCAIHNLTARCLSGAIAGVPFGQLHPYTTGER